MGNLLPQFLWRPSDTVLLSVVLNHMAPAAAATLGTEQFFKPFTAQNKYGVCIDHQLCLFAWDASRHELFRSEKVQKIFLAIALYPLFWMGWAVQLSFGWPSPSLARLVHVNDDGELLIPSLACPPVSILR